MSEAVAPVPSERAAAQARAASSEMRTSSASASFTTFIQLGFSVAVKAAPVAQVLLREATHRP
jgi:hypothetical protein